MQKKNNMWSAAIPALLLAVVYAYMGFIMYQDYFLLDGAGMLRKTVGIAMSVLSAVLAVVTAAYVVKNLMAAHKNDPKAFEYLGGIHAAWGGYIILAMISVYLGYFEDLFITKRNYAVNLEYYAFSTADVKDIMVAMTALLVLLIYVVLRVVLNDFTRKKREREYDELLNELDTVKRGDATAESQFVIASRKFFRKYKHISGREREDKQKAIAILAKSKGVNLAANVNEAR